jgi:hypothetical protein
MSEQFAHRNVGPESREYLCGSRSVRVLLLRPSTP